MANKNRQEKMGHHWVKEISFPLFFVPQHHIILLLYSRSFGVTFSKCCLFISLNIPVLHKEE